MVLGLVTDSDCVELVCVALATTGCSARNSVEPTWFYTSFFLLCTNTSSLELRERLVIASWVFCQELNNCIQILLMKLLTYFRQRNNNRTLSHPKWVWDFVWTWDVQICVSLRYCWVGRITDFSMSGHRWGNSSIQVRNLHSLVGQHLRDVAELNINLKDYICERAGTGLILKLQRCSGEKQVWGTKVMNKY